MFISQYRHAVSNFLILSHEGKPSQCCCVPYTSELLKTFERLCKTHSFLFFQVELEPTLLRRDARAMGVAGASAHIAPSTCAPF